MTDHDTIAAVVPLLLVGSVLGYCVVARRLTRASISAPMVFVTIGVLAGGTVFDVVSVAAGAHWLLLVAEVTLAILLFSDASHLRMREVRADPGPAVRLLLIGFPLTLVAGTLLAYWLFPDDGWVAAALIAALLAPTDAALGAAVVSDSRVPSRVRRILNVESGLNDGLATPVVTVLIVLLASETGRLGDQNWVAESAWSLAVAIVVAFGVGGLGGIALRWAHGRSWTSQLSEQVAVLALALLCYFVAVAVDGNGFVAAFVGGMVFGFVAPRQLRGQIEFAETTGLLASYVVWIAFGVVFVGPALTDAGIRTYVMAIGALTVVRLVPVAIALIGGGWDRRTVLFLGWFGPRGLATVIFALIALADLGETALADHIVGVASVTVLLSIVLHGVSASPLAGGYGRWAAGLPATAPERAAVSTLPSTRRLTMHAHSDGAA